jgi:hypothetical protein
LDARASYAAGRDKRSREVEVHEGRSRTIGYFRLGVALGAIFLTGAIVWSPLPQQAWFGVAGLVLGFVILVVVHARVINAKEHAVSALHFYARGLDRLDGKWVEFPSTGENFETPNHPYTGDLDIFGRASLFQLLDATETRFGALRLALWLRGEHDGTFPTSVRSRQDAVKDLAPRLEFRERLYAAGALLGADKPDPEPFLKWASGEVTFTPGIFLPVLARLLPVCTLASIAFSSRLPAWSWVGFVALQFLVASPFRARVLEIAGSVSSREHGFVRYGDMLELIENEPFESALLKGAKASLAKTGVSATREMATISRIIGFLDARNNEVFRLFIGPILMWDVNCVLALESWRRRAGTHVRAWLEALGEVEALASVAGLAFDRPEYAWPVLSETPQFEANALGHPLLSPEKRINNDVTLQGRGFALIITGSNMSGKSTLLRAMGVNVVLALLGAPVCAVALTLGELRVVTSMRIKDSLEEGVSHFYAELQKLKLVIDLARGDRTVFFLLDEILHGTNTRERLIGARAIVRELLARGAMGAVSTHDLGIGDLEAELDGRAKNVHFEEQVVEEKMTFDYKLREGLVQSSNALRLMKIVGIDVL